MLLPMKDVFIPIFAEFLYFKNYQISIFSEFLKFLKIVQIFNSKTIYKFLG